MQIFPINPTNNSIVSSSQRRNKNISFQSAETALILMVAREGVNNLFLIGSLDKTYYKDFVEENRTTINQTKQFVKQFLQRNCSSDEFGLFQFYNEKLSNL